MTTSNNDAGMNWASREVAERRSRGQAARGEIYGQATELMLDLTDVRTGTRVLDVAPSGNFPPSFFIHPRVDPRVEEERFSSPAYRKVRRSRA